MLRGRAAGVARAVPSAGVARVRGRGGRTTRHAVSNASPPFLHACRSPPWKRAESSLVVDSQIKTARLPWPTQYRRPRTSCGGAARARGAASDLPRGLAHHARLAVAPEDQLLEGLCCRARLRLRQRGRPGDCLSLTGCFSPPHFRVRNASPITSLSGGSGGTSTARDRNWRRLSPASGRPACCNRPSARRWNPSAASACTFRRRVSVSCMPLCEEDSYDYLGGREGGREGGTGGKRGERDQVFPRLLV